MDRGYGNPGWARANARWPIRIMLAGLGASAACSFCLTAVAAAALMPPSSLQPLDAPLPVAAAGPRALGPLPPVSPPPLPVTPPAVPSPSLPPLPTPTLPVSLTPSPSVPPVGATPGASPTPSSAPGGGLSQGTNGNGSSSGGPFRGVTLPFTTIVLGSPLDVALAVSLAVLPLTLGIWLLLFGRTWNEARRAKDARIRLALANDLGLSPRELSSLTTKGLFKLREKAAFDDLTGVLRRAAGIAAMEREIARARRHKSPLTVAFIDVDGLKEANDSRGHKVGDELLRGLASALKSGLRGQDLVLRYGGDEFVCALPDTPMEAGGEKLRQIQVEAARTEIRFSVGLAQLERSDDVVSLLGRADRELYDVKARRSGIHELSPEDRHDENGKRRVPA